jgi:hypothetical protein
MTTKTEWDNRVEAEYQAGNLTPHYRAVLIVLLTFRGHGGRIFPSHESIASRVVQSGAVRTCCVRTVERALNQARDLGMLWWLPQSRREGWRRLRTSNLYFINVPAGPVKSGRGPVWPRRSTDRQAVSVQGKEERKAYEGPAPSLAAVRKMMEARLAARKCGVWPSSP